MSRPIYDLLLKGQSVLVKGNKGTYQVANAIKQSVFKAHIQGTSTPVILKTEDHPVIYQREVDVYEFDCIQKSPYIRSMLEVIDNDIDKCMIFQWMGSDLWSLRKQRHRLNPLLPKIMVKSVLKGLIPFSDMDGQGAGVHTDVNPNNILVSDADTPSPVVKLADLGGLIHADDEHPDRLQGFAIRAPEIWMGRAPLPACDVWSLGVSLVHFLAGKPFFGPSNMNIRLPSKPLETTQAAWSIGKIIQLLGPLPRNEDARFTDEFNIAEFLVRKGVIKLGSLEDELRFFDVPEDCVQFVLDLLVLDPEKRPTVTQALEHPWLQDIRSVGSS